MLYLWDIYGMFWDDFAMIIMCFWNDYEKCWGSLMGSIAHKRHFSLSGSLLYSVRLASHSGGCKWLQRNCGVIKVSS